MSILDSDETIAKRMEIDVVKTIVERIPKTQNPQSLSNAQIGALIWYNHLNLAIDARATSYDFCYLYFQRNRGLLGGSNMEQSCMQLWSYLASWGMLRGSSALLQHSSASLKPLIEYLDTISNSVIWKSDVNRYSKEEILKVTKQIIDILFAIFNVPPTITLVTKVMLGVFGCVPAIDKYVYTTLHALYGGFGVLEERELDNIEDLYYKHQKLIDGIKIPVIDFDGNPTKLYYKKAKLIDMFAFTLGKIITHK